MNSQKERESVLNNQKGSGRRAFPGRPGPGPPAPGSALTAGARQATMAWGVEARVPFLDKDFMEVVMSLDPDSKLIRKGQVPPPPCHTRCCRSAAHSMLQVSRCVPD